jgi:site-specific DNA-methyltransferase (adenine-specific)
MNRLHYGDNLDVLRAHVADASVDLVYLDPPFNSNASYNILFKSQSGAGTDASIEAFDDSWQWGPAAANALIEITQSGHHKLHILMQAMRTAIGENALMAYLAMMAVRLVELHRVLKPTGSLYLHCDPTASHYLKLLLDAVFGPRQFRNEIVWLSTGPGSPGVRQFLRKHDTIFWYSKGESWTFNVDAVRQPHSDKTRANYKNGLNGSGFVGADHAIHAGGKVPEDWWPFAIAPRGKEYLGYPTQKPIKLLERIIAASSHPGDLVLDPFCGCGTAVDAAQKLGRRWTGIDVTHLAIGLIEKRLHEGYNRDGRREAMWETIGVPKDRDSALRLAAEKPHEFQNWFCLKVGGYPLDGGRKGADRGADGHFYPYESPGTTSTGVISVKTGHNIGVAMVRDLRGVMERDAYPFGLFLSAYEATRPMLAEAIAAGLIDTPLGRFPRLQILTPADIFHGAGARLPPLAPINRRAPRVETRPSHQSGSQAQLL